jgi:hypothetical protein
MTSAAAAFKARGGLVINGAGNAQDATPQSQASNDAFLFVAATQSGGWTYALADYSNRGPSVDLCAPEFASNGGGTSNAAPVVSAAAALVWSVDPGFTNIEVEQILKDAARARADKPAPRTDGFRDGISGIVGQASCYDTALDVGGAVRLAVERAIGRGTAAPKPPLVAFRDLTPKAVGGVATVDVDAHGLRGVAKVVLLLNGEPLGEDLTAPYQFVLDGAALAARGIAAGSLTAEAVDFAGTRGATPAPLAFTVSRGETPGAGPAGDTLPPATGIYDPSGRRAWKGRTLPARKVWRASFQASDNVGLDSIRGYVDGVETGTVAVLRDNGRQRAVRYSLDTRTLANGIHVLQAVAMDGAGNVAEASLRLKVRNPKRR